MGLCICYDLRFPELPRAHFLNGAEILTYPAAFLYKTGAAHWEILLRARAIENQCYVLVAAQTKSNDRTENYGHSIVIDPWGTIVHQMNEDLGSFVCEIDLSTVHKIREKMPCKIHIRSDIFKII